MNTENLVKIGDEYYAKNHPKAKANIAAQTFESSSRMPEGASRSSENICEAPHNMRPLELNKTEARYFQILQTRFPNSYVQAHTIKLQLAEKCWYTPDFSYVLPTGALVFVETKGGFERDDAIVKLKTAARQFPQFTFIKAKYVKGKWTETVMPK